MAVKLLSKAGRIGKGVQRGESEAAIDPAPQARVDCNSFAEQ